MQAIPFLNEHLAWIIDHLEYYKEQTGNHILNNARALLMAGSVLKNPVALQTGMCILQKMLPILIQPHGALREGSTHYQLIVFKWILDAYRFAKLSGFYTEENLQFIYNTLIKMQAVAALFCDQQGELHAFIGDISPDATPLTTSDTLRICYPEYWPAILKPSVNKMHHDDWYALYTQQHKVILNCPSGKYPQQITTHKHNDLCSFVWIFNNQPMLIDTGRARYIKDKISTMQKSATGHNMALVNNLAPLCESIIINGHWCPTPYANATVQVEASLLNEITLMHNGFKRATPVTKHARQIKLLENQLTIRDEFIGKGIVNVKLIWQIHSSFKKKDHELIFCNEQYEMKLDTIAVTPPDIQFIEANDSLGFHSTQYGTAYRHPVLIMNWEAHLPFQTTIIFKVKPCVE